MEDRLAEMVHRLLMVRVWMKFPRTLQTSQEHGVDLRTAPAPLWKCQQLGHGYRCSEKGGAMLSYMTKLPVTSSMATTM